MDIDPNALAAGLRGTYDGLSPDGQAAAHQLASEIDPNVLAAALRADAPGATPAMGTAPTVDSTGGSVKAATPLGEAMAQGMVDWASKPGDMLTGKASLYGADGQLSPDATDWGAQTATMMIGGSSIPRTPGIAAGEAVLGSGPMFDLSRLHEIPNVPQADLPRNVPPRGVPARVTDITNDPYVRERMLETIQSGVDKGGANWYNADPLRERFVQELGDKGDPAFRKYMDLVAATSPRSDVGTNVRNASYYYNRLMNGEGAPAVGDKNPQPYGHMAQRLHQMNVERVAGEGWDPLNNPKPASFVENLVGNQAPVTVDTHAFRLPAILAKDPRFLETAYQTGKDAPKQNIQAMVKSGEIPMDDAASRAAYWQAQPKANEYGAMEQYYKGLGQELGLSPAQTQAAAWVGGGKVTGLASDSTKPFLGFVEDRVNLTAQKLGMDPNEVLSRFIKGEMPLLNVAGAGAAGGAVAAAAAGQGPDQAAY